MEKKFHSDFDSPQASPGFLLWRVSNLWQRKQRGALKSLNITHVQFVLLASLSWLERREKTVSQADIARLAGVDKMMASTVLRTLERKKLLQRVPDPVDTRSLVLQLTASGEKLTKKALGIVEQVDREFFAKVKNGTLNSLFNMLSSEE